MPDLAPQLLRIDTPEGPCAQLRGRWGAAEMGERTQWRALQRQLAAAAPSADLGWDLRGLQWLDHVGAQLLWNHWGRAWPQRLDVADSQRALLERPAQFSHAPLPPEPWRLSDQVDRLGLLVMHALGHAHQITLLIGRLALDVLRLLRAPRQAPWRDMSGHLYNMGAMAMPITALVGFLIGVVLAYLMSLQLRQFGAESFIVNILGISLIRELGPMLAAILVAVAFKMGDWDIRKALYFPKRDTFILVVTFALTVIFDLTVAVEIGLLMSAIFFIQRMARNTGVHKLEPDHGFLFERHSIAGKTLPVGCEAYRVEGALFFGAADSLERIQTSDDQVRVVILQLHRLVMLDTTGMLAMSALHDKLAEAGKTLILCGAGGAMGQMLVDAKLATHVGERNVQPDLAAALVRAEELLRTKMV